jgi:hypothetical protein
VAPATAMYFRAPILAMYPLSLVPLFVGPPLGILTHVLSLRNLSVNRKALSRTMDLGVPFDFKGGSDHDLAV